MSDKKKGFLRSALGVNVENIFSLSLMLHQNILETLHPSLVFYMLALPTYFTAV